MPNAHITTKGSRTPHPLAAPHDHAGPNKTRPKTVAPAADLPHGGERGSQKAIGSQRPALPRGEAPRAASRAIALQTATGAIKTAKPALVKAVGTLESAGGHGVWFASVSPFDVQQKRQGFYLVTAVPPKPDPASAIYLLRTEHSRAYLAGLLAAGVPVLLGLMPDDVTATAAAFGDDCQLGADGLAAGRIEGHKNAILLQPTADKYTLAHEHQHWLDFENPGLESDFIAEMKPFAKAVGLSKDEQAWMVRLMRELRGHVAQELQANRDREAGLPQVGEDGAVHAGKGKQLREIYASACFAPTYLFDSTYRDAISRIVGTVAKRGPASVRALAKLFTRYDLSGQPGTTISFAQYVRGA